MQFETRRPPVGQRRWSSPAVERTLEDVASRVRDPEIAWLFGNCFPNTLDTTVTRAAGARGRGDTGRG